MIKENARDEDIIGTLIGRGTNTDDVTPDDFEHLAQPCFNQFGVRQCSHTKKLCYRLSVGKGSRSLRRWSS